MGHGYGNLPKVLSFKDHFFIKKVLKITQLIFTSSKSTIETIEEGVKYVQSYQ